VQATTNAATQKDFYTLDSEDPALAATFEQRLGQTESRAGKALSEILDKGKWPLGHEERAALAEFFAVQALRGPSHRRHTEQFTSLMWRMNIQLQGREGIVTHARSLFGRIITEEEADLIWARATSSNEPVMRVQALEHMDQLDRLVPKTRPYFLGRPWWLVRYPNSNLFTCDAPVGLIPHRDTPREMGVGPANAWGIAIPIARDTGLVMVDPRPLMKMTAPEAVEAGIFDTEMTPEQVPARLFHHTVICNTRRWIFHHPNDGELIGEDLPELSDSEIREPDTDFVELGRELRVRHEQSKRKKPKWFEIFRGTLRRR
jgi:hypothetical protein